MADSATGAPGGTLEDHHTRGYKVIPVYIRQKTCIDFDYTCTQDLAKRLPVIWHTGSQKRDIAKTIIYRRVLRVPKKTQKTPVLYLKTVS